MRTSCEDQNLQNPGTEVRIIDNDGAPGWPPGRPPRGRGWTGPFAKGRGKSVSFGWYKQQSRRYGKLIYKSSRKNMCIVHKVSCTACL